MADKPEELIEEEVKDIFDLEQTLSEVEQELMTNELFRKFLEMQKSVKEQSEKIWKNIETQMIEHDVKSLKGDWGSLTITERLGWDIDVTQLPTKFLKKVVDSTKLTTAFRLEGKAPKGATPKYSKYLMKKIK